MKKAYNFPSGLPCIKLNNDEIKVIEKVIKICDEGDKLRLSLKWKVNEVDELKDVYEQGRDFGMAKICLNDVLARGNLYYYKERKRYMENYSKWMKATHKAWKEKGTLLFLI